MTEDQLEGLDCAGCEKTINDEPIGRKDYCNPCKKENNAEKVKDVKLKKRGKKCRH